MLQDYISPTGKDFQEMFEDTQMEYKAYTMLSLKGQLQAELSQDEVRAMKEHGAAAGVERARKSNRPWLLRLDHMLMVSVGVGLAHFLPQRRLLRLDPGDRRELVQVTRREDDEKEDRAVITTSSGDRRYELPRQKIDGCSVWPALHLSMDQGSIGLPGILFLVHHCGIRATCHFVVFHRLNNDVLDSIVGSGLAMVRLSFYQVIRMRRGPFGGQANHSVLQAAASEISKVLDENSTIFQLVYDDLLADTEHLRAQPNAGAQEHMAETFRWACRSLQEISCGAEAKTSRWWAWETLSR